MKRIREIINDVRNKFPYDDFFHDFEESCRISPGKRRDHCLYDRALMSLDAESWLILKDKALRHYLDHREGQRKQGFFNQLNEAFAYRYLVRQGCSEVRLIKEDGTRSPDISFIIDKAQRYCEVKTLGISDDEIDRRTSGDVFDGRYYVHLSKSFLDKKFSDAITHANEQILSRGQGLIYVIMRFDDIALDYYENYKKQLIRFSIENRFDNLFIKIGLRGNKRISVNLNLRWRWASASR